MRTAYDNVEPFDPKTGLINVVVEASRGTRHKYKYEPSRGLFMLSKILAAGFAFPFDFGYIPGTCGDDHDPVDVLVVNEEPTFPGCIVPSRLIGVIELKKTLKGTRTPYRNDRLIAVPHASTQQEQIKNLNQLDAKLIKQLEIFLKAYPEAEGHKIQITGRGGPERALKLLKQGIEKQHS